MSEFVHYPVAAMGIFLPKSAPFPSVPYHEEQLAEHIMATKEKGLHAERDQVGKHSDSWPPMAGMETVKLVMFCRRAPRYGGAAENTRHRSRLHLKIRFSLHIDGEWSTKRAAPHPARDNGIGAWLLRWQCWLTTASYMARWKRC